MSRQDTALTRTFRHLVVTCGIPKFGVPSVLMLTAVQEIAVDHVWDNPDLSRLFRLVFGLMVGASLLGIVGSALVWFKVIPRR